MCGIFAIINNKSSITQSQIEKSFDYGKNRGPDDSKLQVYDRVLTLGFHRLSINGIDRISNQPLIIDNIHLICNGEIYNYKQLYSQLQIEPISNSDCEIIIHLYRKFGIEKTIQLLDGVFAFVLLDKRDNLNKIYVARDPFGVRPLYFYNKNNILAFASELKSISPMFTNGIRQFTPGTYTEIIMENQLITSIIENQKYYNISVSPSIDYYSIKNIDYLIYNIQQYFMNAVYKRFNNCMRPVACLLSGGLDSSLVTAIANKLQLEKNNQTIETYSIGFFGSDDLYNANIVANKLKTKHTEIFLEEYNILGYINKIIRDCETYDVTTIRASIGNYILGEYISKNSEAKVILNGDGADELQGGYLYFNKIPNALEFDLESQRLLKDISYFDVLRSDKCISSHGLEPRTPFLDKSFVNYYLSIPSELRYTIHQTYGEKYLIRKAFTKKYFSEELLPDEILFRRKEAFSDGVSKQHKNLFDIIKDEIKTITNLNEKQYYRKIFDQYYPGHFETIPYYWMPKYIEANDPSARMLFDTKTKLENQDININIAIQGGNRTKF
jgi:asparagine synthase (glutamine-hydrolysing)